MSKLMLESIGFKGICVAPPLKFGFMYEDKPAFCAFIERVQKWDFERIVVTQGEVIESGAKGMFDRIMRRFAA